MKLKTYIYVNEEWWRVFLIDQFSQPEPTADIGERKFYESLKKHRILFRNKEGQWNNWVGNGADFIVSAANRPSWIPKHIN